MIKNYFKIAWRNITKNKMFSLINIIGLAIGVTCCVLIYLYVDYETSFDRFNINADRLYRVTTVGHDPKKTDRFAPSSPIMAVRLKANFPEVQDYTRLNFSSRTMSYKDKKFFETKVLYADSSLLEMFTFPMVEGNAHTALKRPYSVVLTESVARKYFGDQPAVGKMVQLSDTVNLMVTGVIRDIPKNSHMNGDCFISRSTMNAMNKNNASWAEASEMNWFNCDSYSYILLKDGANYKLLQTKMNAMIDRETADLRKAMGMWLNIELQPVADIHLRSDLSAEFKGSIKGNITYVYIFIGSAFLILLIACCNFINLSTARSLKRSKEIGLRKVVGARRTQLISQFLSESIVIAGIASIISLVLVFISLPLLNSFAGSTLSFSGKILWVYLLIIAGVGLLAGLYPALMMSSFTPVQSLKGHITHSLGDVVFRKGLVVFQFGIAVILIIGTLIILQQLEFIQKRNLGINREHIVSIPLRGRDRGKADMIVKEMAQHPKVTSASLNSFSFKGMANITLLPEGFAENEVTSCNVISVDEDFITTYCIHLAAGRNFSKEFTSDVKEAFIVNEAAVKAFNWQTPEKALGKKLNWGGAAGGKEGKIIGVVKNFNYASLHEQVQPLLIHIFPQWYSQVTLRLKAGDVMIAMHDLEGQWKALTIESPFSYTFAEDDYNSLYRSEQAMRGVLGAFSFLSVMVACLGLFGLASFAIEQRVKEIGIRKVLGSSVGGIIRLLSADFLKLVLIAFVIGAPIVWYVMKKWLQNYAYRIEIGVPVFAYTALLVLGIAFITVFIKAIKAATSNPVKSLRTE